MIARILMLMLALTWMLTSHEQLGRVLGVDARSTSEREVDRWGHPRRIALRTCFDKYPRKDGRVRCSVQFADSLVSHTVWCMSKEGCRWF